jgi:SAM-dependent methyltransferase
LPADFRRTLDELAESYLCEEDPIRQSGFGGGALRWRTEREPILEAVESEGDLLDVGCANGYLLECLVAWGRERGLRIVPHGLDRSHRLVALARQRLPCYRDNLHVGDAWEWVPPRRYRHVYALHDCVPQEYLGEYVERLLGRVVAAGGRLIVGAYGSRSQGMDPFDVAAFLRSMGYRVAGTAAGGQPPITRFAWVDS